MDVLVVGAGVIGLALAWRAAQAGMSVRVVERDIPGAGATSVAAGILSPVIFGDWEGADDAFNLRAVAGWNLFADELSAAAGTCLPYSRTGALYIGERAQFENVRGGQRLDEKECRELEPGLAAGAVRMFMAAEAAVDTEMLVLTLLQACTHAGVLVSAHTHTPPRCFATRVDAVWGWRSRMSGSLRKQPCWLVVAGRGR